MESIKKIVIIGPESTGKSKLAAELARHYKTSWCPEYAREYLHENGPSYTFNDLLSIAKGQAAQEDAWLQAAKPPFYFIDTNLYVMKVWCEVVFNDCHKWILRGIAERHYDHYLLCATDLPWEPDPLREYPDDATRLRLWKMYHDILVNSGVPFSVVSGRENKRLEMAIRSLDARFGY